MKVKTTLLCLLAGSRLVMAGLTEADIHSLQFMREEEKLARDVYLHLYEIYGSPQFTNIARSEQRHTDSVLSLMNLYGVEDTVLEEQGQFSDPKLQALYDELVALGAQSQAAAFQVGILVEEVDIADLDEAIESTDNPDMIRVFNNLRNGSYKHLDAFSRGLASVAGFSDASYEAGWFLTWMGWVRLDNFPWVQSVDGHWLYHWVTPSAGRFFGTLSGKWYWSSQALYPWHYDVDAGAWDYGVPAP